MRRATALSWATLISVTLIQAAVAAVAPPEVLGLSAVIDPTIDRAGATMVLRAALVSTTSAVPLSTTSTVVTATTEKPPTTTMPTAISLPVTTTTAGVSSSTHPTAVPPTSPTPPATTTTRPDAPVATINLTATTGPVPTTTAAPPVTPTSAGPTPQSFSVAAESDFVSRINNLRASVGLNGLATNAVLINHARWSAKQMADTGKFAHSNIGSLLLNPWSVVSENVAQGASVNSIFNALVASPSHYPHMVDPLFTAVGIGAYTDSTGRLWTAQVFGG